MASQNAHLSPETMILAQLNHDIGHNIGYLTLAIVCFAIFLRFPSFLNHRIRPISRPASFKSQGYFLFKSSRSNITGPSTAHVSTPKTDRRPSAHGSSSSLVFWAKLRLVRLFNRNVLGTSASLGGVLLMLTHAGLLVFLALYKNVYAGVSGPKYRRFGLIAVSQFPLLFILAMKNSPLANLIGVGYEKLNFLHRFVGRMIFVFALVHGALQMRLQYDFTGSIRFHGSSLTGLIALCACGLMSFTGTKFLRNSFYQAFLIVHILGYVIMIVTLWIHSESSRPFLGPSIAFLALDNLLKVFKSRVKRATFTAMPAGLTRIEIQGVNDGWRAGQHVFIRVLKGRHMFEKHPFTIANAPDSSTPFGTTGHLLLVVKAAGDFTKRIHQLAGQPRQNDANSSGEKSAASLTAGADVESLGDALSGDPHGSFSSDVTHRVLLDGPYGNSFVDMTRYRTVLLIAGGSGFTYCMASLEDIIGEAVKSGTSLTKQVFVVWSVRGPEMVNCFSRELEETIRVGQTCGIDVAVQVFFTKGGSQKDINQALADRAVEFGFTRPNLAQIVEDVAKGRALTAGGGLGVGVCGPLGLVDSVAQGVTDLSPDLIQQIGGVKLQTEKFGW